MKAFVIDGIDHTQVCPRGEPLRDCGMKLLQFAGDDVYAHCSHPQTRLPFEPMVVGVMAQAPLTCEQALAQLDGRDKDARSCRQKLQPLVDNRVCTAEQVSAVTSCFRSY